MLVSKNSLKNYVVVNGFLLSIGFAQYSVLVFYCQEVVWFNNFMVTLSCFVARNYLLLNFINYSTQTKQKIAQNYGDGNPRERYKFEFHKHVVTSTAVEAVTHIVISTGISTGISISTGTSASTSTSVSSSLLYFIPVSFLFEIIFDFFHYGTHR